MDKIFEFIRSKTREQWVEFVRDKWLKARIWAQEHGERAIGAGFIAGFIFAILLFYAFKFTISVLLLVAILAAGIYFLADSNAPAKSDAKPEN